MLSALGGCSCKKRGTFEVVSKLNWTLTRPRFLHFQLMAPLIVFENHRKAVSGLGWKAKEAPASRGRRVTSTRKPMKPVASTRVQEHRGADVVEVAPAECWRARQVRQGGRSVSAEPARGVPPVQPGWWPSGEIGCLVNHDFTAF